MKTHSASLKFLLAVLLSYALAACSGGSGGHNGPPTLPSASSLPASCTTASVGQAYSCQIADTGGKSPFTWSVTGLPAGLSSTVSGDTTSDTISGTPQKPAAAASRHAAVVQAAASDPSFTANVSVTVTDAKQRTATLSFTITINEPAALAIQTSSLPAGTVGVAYSASLAATGGVSPDSWNWSAQSGSSLPPGLSLGSSSGAISGTPTTAGTFNVTVTVTDSESPAATASANFTITISAATAALAIQTSSLAGGNVGTAYSANLTAHGGVTPYTWSWAAQSGSSLPPGLTIVTNADNSGTISGTPTAAATYQVTVSVKDSETPAVSVNANFTITITAATACTASQTTLCGQFAIFVQGFDAAGAYAFAGSFTSNGTGITAGVVDMNSFDGSATAVPVTAGAPSAVSVGPDGRGALTLATSNAAVGNHTFTFALNSAGTFADVIEFDDTTANGTGHHASGYLQAQDSTTFGASSLAGKFAFGFAGGENTGVRFATIGLTVLGTSGCGIGSNGSTTVTNEGGAVTHNISFTCSGNGLASIDSTTGRGTVTLTYSPAIAASAALDYSFYVIGGGKLIFIATDPGATGVPVLGGIVKRQRNHPNGFSSADLNCGGSGAPDVACLLVTSGAGGGGTHVQVGAIVQVSAGSYSVTLDDNKAGVVNSATLPGLAATISAAGEGTVTCPQCNPTDFVLTDTDTSIVLVENGGVSFGSVDPQTARAFASPPGRFILVTVPGATTLVPNASGVAIIAAPGAGGAGTFTATFDVEQTSTSPFLISAAGVSGAYTLDTAKGRATGTTTSPGPATFVLWILDAQDFVVMGTDSTNLNPPLFFFSQ